MGICHVLYRSTISRPSPRHLAGRRGRREPDRLLPAVLHNPAGGLAKELASAETILVVGAGKAGAG